LYKLWNTIFFNIKNFASKMIHSSLLSVVACFTDFFIFLFPLIVILLLKGEVTVGYFIVEGRRNNRLFHCWREKKQSVILLLKGEVTIGYFNCNGTRLCIRSNLFYEPVSLQIAIATSCDAANSCIRLLLSEKLLSLISKENVHSVR